MKNLFEHTNAFWAKYAAYEWRVAADGKQVGCDGGQSNNDG